MRMIDALRLSGANLRKNPLRTVLTILGLGVGVGAILTVITLGVSGEARVEQEIARLGVDKVWITAAEDGARLNAQSAGRIAEATGANACAGAATAALVTWEGDAALCAVSGYDAGFAAVYAPQVQSGRLFDVREQASGAPVALVDEALAERMGGEVVGRRIDVGARKVRIIGVIAPVTASFGSATEGTVCLPLTTFLDTYAGDVATVTLEIPRGVSAEKLGEQAVAAMASQGAFAAESMQAEIEAVEQVVRIFVMVLSCVAAVCMLTGAIGVMNILLVSVRERRREIGLIKAIGGASAQVGVLFLLEAVCYALLGGLLGLGLGVVMIRLFGVWIGLDASLSVSVALPTLLLAALLGVVFGVVPALRASKLLPVDALRQDS